MTQTAPRPSVAEASPGLSNPGVARKGNVFVDWLTTTDHKKIGYLYLITSFAYFLIGGVMALVIRAQLFAPGLEVVATKEQYNQLFTMHGTIMLLMFATPLFAGFANVLMPLQIGSPDVAFPRLNALAYWFFSFGSLIAVAGFLTPQGAASFGWFAYTPLSSQTFSPGLGGNMWVFGSGFEWVWHHFGCRELHHHHHHHAGARNDDVADAYFHLEHAGDLDFGAPRLPGSCSCHSCFGKRPGVWITRL